MLKKVLRARPYRVLISTGIWVGAFCMMPSCSDDYEWAQEKPSWLGQSIYDELARRGNFGIYLKMVDDLGRTEFLSKTGSVTVFVADDDTYRAYFKAQGVDENHISTPMKRFLVNTSMLENAYVLDLLTNQPSGDNILKGQVMRRTNTQWSVYDSIPAVSVAELPEASVSADYWGGLRGRHQSVYNLIEEGTVPMVHFIWRQMMSKGITKKDFSYLFNGTEFQEEDVYINNVKVREGNVTCQNGYIHIMEGVPEPLPNMAGYLRTNGNTSLFSKLMDRYSAPFVSVLLTNSYKDLHDLYANQNLYPVLAGGDSIYGRRYFFSSADGNSLTSYNGSEVDGVLKFDPSRNDYAEGNIYTINGVQTNNVNLDMGAIFAPTDEALNSYWNSENGSFLRERYPSEEPFENVPNNVLAEFLNNHMQYSFLSSLPSKFNLVLDDAKDPVGLDEADIIKGSTAVCNNGAVYVMKKAYAPASFRSVLAPTLVNENMKIMNWAIRSLEFRPYLLSMVSHYDFMILTDEALSRYIDPVSYSGTDPRWFKFYYNAKKNQVEAYSYRYDKKLGGWAGCTEDDMRILGSTLQEDSEGNSYYQINPVVENRLTDLLNFCIVPRDVNGGNYVGNGSVYYQTKDDGPMKVEKVGGQVTVTDQYSGEKVTTQDFVTMDNGVYYVLDQMVQPTFHSLMQELVEHPEYSEFYELLLGNEEWTTNESNLYSLISTKSLNMNDDNAAIQTFSSYHYTVYVPDNAAMEKAYSLGLPRWKDINNLANVYAGTDVNVDSLKQAYTQRVMNFLKYHFQDNAVYIGGDARNMSFETAATHSDGADKGLSYTLRVNSDATGITVADNSEKTGVVRITTENPEFYNRMTREYTFSEKTENGNINASSYVVVHRVNEPLIYDDECFCLKDNERVPED